MEHSDTQIVAYYASDLRKYVIRTRNWMVPPLSPGAQVRAPRYVASRRSIGRTESKDFRRFPPSDVLYTNGGTCLPGAPREHLLFPTVWHATDDSNSALVVSSHDGRVWNYHYSAGFGKVHELLWADRGAGPKEGVPVAGGRRASRELALSW